MLQTRNAKRPAQAAVRFAVDAVAEGLLTRERGARDDRRRVARRAAAPDVRPARPSTRCSRAASPPRRAPPRARSCSPRRTRWQAAEEGRDVILVRPFTEADDVAGFHAAHGILTSEGGKASHAALVARGMGTPGGHRRRRARRSISRPARSRSTGLVLHEGDLIAIDGTTGAITIDDVPLVEAQIDEHFETVLAWADELRTLGVRANADTPEDARRARELRRRGDRAVPDRAHVHGRGPPAEDAGDDHGRRREAAPRRRWTSCCRSSRSDFEGLFEAMAGLPVTIRLLDPPLHEFLPNLPELLAAQLERARIDRARRPRRSSSGCSTRVAGDLRGATRCSAPAACRLGILYPEIYEMQVGRSCAPPSARRRAAATPRS